MNKLRTTPILISALVLIGMGVFYVLGDKDEAVGQAVINLTTVELSRDEWLGSKVGVEFNTPSGLPEVGTYAKMHDGYWFGMSNETYEIEYIPYDREQDALDRISRDGLTQIATTGEKLYISDFEYVGKRYVKYGTTTDLRNEYEDLKQGSRQAPALQIRKPISSYFLKPVYAAIAKDNQAKQGCGGASSCTAAFTTSGSDRYLIVMTYHSVANLTSVTHNGNTLTERAVETNIHHHAYANPDTSGNLTATLDGVAGGFRWHAQSYTGVQQQDDGGTDATNTTSGTSITCTHSPTTDDHFTWMSVRSTAGDGSAVAPTGYAYDTFFLATGVSEIESTSATSSGTEAVTSSGHPSGTLYCVISEIVDVNASAGTPEATTTPQSALQGNSVFQGNSVIR